MANIKPAKEIPSKQVTTTDFGVISTDLATNHLLKVYKKTPPRESRTEIYLPTSLVRGFIMKSSRDNTCIQLRYKHKHRSVVSHVNQPHCHDHIAINPITHESGASPGWQGLGGVVGV